eukprot:m.105111 g.105111  ORF g.105111 m.105111 type:complete len:282 (+) comp15691_c0_seq1:2072-2917(+)
MAVLERRDKDFVSVFTCSSWQMVQHFAVATHRAAGLSWSPDDRSICVWDSTLDYLVAVYAPNGHELGQYSAYKDGLGIKSISWSPCSQLLAVGSYDETVRLLNHATWKHVAEFKHSSTVTNPHVVVYNQVDPATAKDQPGQYEIRPVPFSVPSLRLDPEKPNPRLGVGIVGFSPCSEYLATRNDNMTCTVWIWSVTKLRLVAVLHHTSAVRNVAWHPTQTALAICAGSGRLSFWTPAGCSCVAVPTREPFDVKTLRWANDGASILLLDKAQYCICYAADHF